MDIGEGFIAKFEEHFGKTALKVVLAFAAMGIIAVGAGEFAHYVVVPIYRFVSIVDFSKITQIKSRVVSDVVVTLSATAISAAFVPFLLGLTVTLSVNLFSLLVKHQRFKKAVAEMKEQVLERLNNVQIRHGKFFEEIRPRLDEIFDTAIAYEKDNIAKAEEIEKLKQEISHLQSLNR